MSPKRTCSSALQGRGTAPAMPVMIMWRTFGQSSSNVVARTAALLFPTFSNCATAAVAQLLNVGNNSAAVRATTLLEDCPNVRHIIMTGIAGAVPRPCKAEEHVRLGDIVVSDHYGVVQYEFSKKQRSSKRRPEVVTLRGCPRPPAAVLLEAVKRLRTDEYQGTRPWEELIAKFTDKLGAR